MQATRRAVSRPRRGRRPSHALSVQPGSSVSTTSNPRRRSSTSAPRLAGAGHAGDENLAHAGLSAGRGLAEPLLRFGGLRQLEQAQLTRREPAERARAVPHPVLVRDERHSLPRAAVPQADRAGGLHVLPERTQVEAVKVAGELEVDVQLLLARAPRRSARSSAGTRRCRSSRKRGSRAFPEGGRSAARSSSRARDREAPLDLLPAVQAELVGERRVSANSAAACPSRARSPASARACSRARGTPARCTAAPGAQRRASLPSGGSRTASRAAAAPRAPARRAPRTSRRRAQGPPRARRPHQSLTSSRVTASATTAGDERDRRQQPRAAAAPATGSRSLRPRPRRAARARRAAAR